jgi:hypothetical protein
MQRRRLIFFSSLVFAVAALSACRLPPPPPAHPVDGTTTATAIINTATGTGTVDGTFRFTHLGNGTFHNDLTSFTVTGNTFTFTGTATFVVADDKAAGDQAEGDKVFTTSAGTGTVTSTGSESTNVHTITGGTGRFDDASGTFAITNVGVTVSTVGSIVTQTLTGTVVGQISY